MSFWSAIVLIVLIGAVVSVVRSRHMHGIGHRDPGAGAREAELERELTELRERVRVLERIATDDTQGRRLSDQIERLRED